MHVLFDLDGTLTDSQDGITRCMVHALTALGRHSPDPAELVRFIGMPLAEAFGALLQTSDASLVREALRLYRERFSARGMYENRVYPEIPDILAILQSRGVVLWVATTKPRLFAERILAHFGLQPRFQGVYGSELSGERTDKGDLIRHLLTSEGISGREAVMVGDREQDIRGARENGAGAIGVLWGYGTRKELLSARPDALAEFPRQLVRFVGQPARW